MYAAGIGVHAVLGLLEALTVGIWGGYFVQCVTKILVDRQNVLNAEAHGKPRMQESGHALKICTTEG